MNPADPNDTLTEIKPETRGKDGNAVLERAENPAPNSSFGFASDVYILGDVPSNEPVRLTLPLERELLAERQLDAAATRLFRWDRERGGFRIVPGSGPIDDATFVTGEVAEPGLYVLIGVSTNPIVAYAVALLRETAAADWPAELLEKARRKICEVTLCSSELVATLSSEGKMRYEPFPDLPKGFCQLCRDIPLPDGRLPEFDILEEPKPPPNPFHRIFDRWMLNHPSIAYMTVWREPSPEFGAPKAYPNWRRSQKQDLAEAFWQAIFHLSFDLPVAPLLDIVTPDGNYVQAEVFNRTQAWETYIAYTAQSLAVEYAGRVAWSILDYSDDERRMLLDSHWLFEYVYPYDEAGREGYAIWPGYGMVTPSDPVDTYLWLRSNVALGATALETVTELLTWCHENLEHYAGGSTRANHRTHWQYDGWPPVMRVLEGTTHQWGPRSSGFAHWTAGCWGTTGLLRALLRTINIPVELVPRCAHALPHVVHEERYLSHGDDPYTALDGTPIGELLIDEETFEAWFGVELDEDDHCRNVGQQVRELALEHLPIGLLRRHCDDLANGRSHAESLVYRFFSGKHDLATLEGLDLWGRLDERLAELGGCDALLDP